MPPTLPPSRCWRSGIIASLGKGLDYEEALILRLMLVLFIPVRKFFYRKSALLQFDLSPQWLLLAAIVVLGSTWLGFFSYKHVEYSNELWWEFALQRRRIALPAFPGGYPRSSLPRLPAIGC